MSRTVFQLFNYLVFPSIPNRSFSLWILKHWKPCIYAFVLFSAVLVLAEKNDTVCPWHVHEWKACGDYNCCCLVLLALQQAVAGSHCRSFGFGVLENALMLTLTMKNVNNSSSLHCIFNTRVHPLRYIKLFALLWTTLSGCYDTVPASVQIVKTLMVFFHEC